MAQRDTFRTPETEEKYALWRAAQLPGAPCVLCTREPLKRFKYWKIVFNEFPYDRIATRHDMLVPLRHASGAELNDAERAELEVIKQGYAYKEYRFIIEVGQTKSMPSHFHLHLLEIKERFSPKRSPLTWLTGAIQ